MEKIKKFQFSPRKGVIGIKGKPKDEKIIIKIILVHDRKGRAV